MKCISTCGVPSDWKVISDSRFSSGPGPIPVEIFKISPIYQSNWSVIIAVYTAINYL